MENFQMIEDHFKQDLREFWNRANFYLVVNTVLFSAFTISNPFLMNVNKPLIILVSLLGLAIAIVWFLVLRGALFWIEQWRKQVIKLSNELDRFHTYEHIENLSKQKIKSPSYLTHFLPIAFIIVWLAILVMTILG
jgi:hypothetical protein